MARSRAAASSNPQTAFFGAWIFCFWIGQLFQMLSGDLLTYWRVPYDHEQAARKVLEAGLPPYLARVLLTGGSQ